MDFDDNDDYITVHVYNFNILDNQLKYMFDLGVTSFSDRRRNIFTQKNNNNMRI